MKRLAEILLGLGQTDTQPASSPTTALALPAEPTLSPEALSVQYAVIAAGICVLIIWVIIRIARGRKLWLANTPARPNSLDLPHVLVLLLGMFGIDVLVSLAGMRLFGSPHEGSDDYARMAIVVGAGTKSLTLVLALLVAHFAFRHGLRRGLGLTARHWMYDSARGVIAFLAVVPICALLGAVGRWIVPESLRQFHHVLQFLAQPGTEIWWRILAVVMAGVLAPIAEEVLFRGLIQSALRKWLHSPWMAIGITSVLFAAIHIPYYHTMPALVALAIALGYNYERTGRLWASILIHMLFNGLSLTTTLMSVP